MMNLEELRESCNRLMKARTPGVGVFSPEVELGFVKHLVVVHRRRIHPICVRCLSGWGVTSEEWRTSVTTSCLFYLMH